LLDEELLPEENVNAYLFEAPGVMMEDNIHEHPAIRNVINSGDLIVNALPTAFGFKRSGMDVDIYSTDADKIVSDFYKEKLKLSPFTPKTDYKTEQELADYLLNTILLKKVEINPEDENPLATHDASTRENYVDNYEKELAYAIGLFFSLKNETIDALKAKLEELGFGVIGLLQEDELYNTLKPILDEHEEVYDDEQLHSACNRVAEFGRFQLSTIATFYMDEGAKNDIIRLVEFHSPETVLPLLINYNASLRG